VPVMGFKVLGGRSHSNLQDGFQVGITITVPTLFAWECSTFRLVDDVNIAIDMFE
jgi:hypothetical protein